MQQRVFSSSLALLFNSLHRWFLYLPLVLSSLTLRYIVLFLVRFSSRFSSHRDAVGGLKHEEVLAQKKEGFSSIEDEVKPKLEQAAKQLGGQLLDVQIRDIQVSIPSSMQAWCFFPCCAP